MIDTDKYEGHAEGDWNWTKLGTMSGILLDKHGKDIVHLMMPYDLYSNPTDATALLLADAPLLLEDYKRLLKNINEYVDKVEAFHKMLKEEYEMKHKIPLCPENKDEPTKHNWVMDDWVGHRCVDCGFHLGKPLSPPRAKKHFEWRGDE
jgi:hypothetical protein